MVSRLKELMVASVVYSRLLSEFRHELTATDTSRKATITDRNLVLILYVSVYLQAAKIGTIFSICPICRKFYTKL
ncbi:hypothetical protein EVD33_02995 [Bacteroidales bacterium SW292]|nr:hypothetical protein [Bacteroidales bacterium SW292]